MVEATESLWRLHELVRITTAPAIVAAARSVLDAASALQGSGVPALIELELDERRTPRTLSPVPLPVQLARLILDESEAAPA